MTTSTTDEMLMQILAEVKALREENKELRGKFEALVSMPSSISRGKGKTPVMKPTSEECKLPFCGVKYPAGICEGVRVADNLFTQCHDPATRGPLCTTCHNTGAKFGTVNDRIEDGDSWLCPDGTNRTPMHYLTYLHKKGFEIEEAREQCKIYSKHYGVKLEIPKKQLEPYEAPKRGRKPKTAAIQIECKPLVDDSDELEEKKKEKEEKKKKKEEKKRKKEEKKRKEEEEEKRRKDEEADDSDDEPLEFGNNSDSGED